MTPTRILNVSLLAAVFSAALLSAGCATPPPTADKLVMVPMGTVTTYHRKSSGSLGNFDGKVVWTHSATTWQGQPAIAFGAPQAGTTVHDSSFKALASLDAAGKTVATYDPPMGYSFPLHVGKTWTSSHTVTMVASGRTVSLKTDGKVVSWGDVTVPAGTYKAYQLEWTDSLGEKETRWVSPADGIATVKRHVERPATHPQGAGVLDAELLSMVLPAK
jgi:hypothetical protein